MHVVKCLSWYVPGMEDKLIYASLVHDLLLSKDYWLKVRREDHLESFQIPMEDRAVIRKHACLMAAHMLKISTSFDDVATIIQQHHGQKSGLTLMKSHEKIDLDLLHPLSQVFLVSEELVHYIMESSEMGQTVGKFGFSEYQFLLSMKNIFHGKNMKSLEEAISKIPFWREFSEESKVA
jgi:hypothetical protein